MANFIQGDNFKRNGGKYEEIVWIKIKEAFSRREVLGYSRYPLFFNTGQRRKEPDILILDKEIGLIIIEVKGYEIDDIENLYPNSWQIKGEYKGIYNPIGQAEDYLYAIKSKFDIDRNLRDKYNAKYFVALPRISKNEWNERNFEKIIDEAYLIFKDDLARSALIKKILSQQPFITGALFNDNTFKIATSILANENIYADKIEDEFSNETKGKIYGLVTNKLHELDIQQEVIAKSIVPGPQRIRGIAGSGKSVLLCQKAAIMHLRYPEWKIAVVFFTQSLYDNIINMIDRYLKAFSNGEVSYDECGNLEVLHAWGRKNRNGFYREIANRNNCIFRSARDVKSEVGYLDYNNSINYISKKLLEECKGNLERIYDVILIDEGQDLIGDDEYKYEGKQSFYYMAYQSLKVVEGEEGKIRRLIWAYDELQSLNDKKIPSSKEIFGDSNLVKGKYKGGVNKSEVMKKCYRTPYQILTTAHAVGMGIFREEGLVSGYTTKEDWENIGYEIKQGDFRKIGNEIVIKRSIENSPNPIQKYFKGDTVKLELYNSEFHMIKALANDIKKDIEKEGLNPSRDILIINLKENRNGKIFEQEIGNYLNNLNIDFYIPSKSKSNEYDCDWRDEKPDQFWYDGAVTLSQVPRAKGNEAPMVYVVGLEEIAVNEDSVKYRNKLFTAMTRAKCWVKLMGVGDYSLYDEIREAIKSNGEFRFKFTKPKKETNDLS